MRRRFYQVSTLIILIGTISIAGWYILATRRSEPAPSADPAATELAEVQDLTVFTPVPTSTPFLPPLESSISGDIHYFYGDWESAITGYEDTLAQAQTPEEGSAALLGLGKVFFQKGDFSRRRYREIYYSILGIKIF